MAENTMCQRYDTIELVTDVGTPSHEYDLDLADASCPVLARALSDAIVRSIVESDEWPSFVEELRKVGDDDDFDDLLCKPTSKQYVSWVTEHSALETIPEDKRHTTSTPKDSASNRLQREESCRCASADPSNNDGAFRKTDKKCRSVQSPSSEARHRRAIYLSSHSGIQQGVKLSGGNQVLTPGKNSTRTSPPLKCSKNSLTDTTDLSISDKNSLEWSGEIEQFRAALFSSGSSGDCDLVKSAFQITKSGSSILALEQLFLTADQARRLHDNLPSPAATKVGSLQLKRLANKPCEEAPSAPGVSKRSLRRLGRGAFGRVFGVHIKGRLVAVKDVRNVDSPCEKNASQLLHRHVVRTLYVTSLEPRRFLVVMEYGGPRTLEHILEQGPLRLQETLRFGRQMASALHYCHRCNVLHLDVKPSNILVHNADCKLADFGSSAIRGTKPKVCGTVQYMAPEVLCGQRPDFPSDVYSLGVVLWQMQSGVRPFDGLHQHAVIFQVVRQQARPQFGQSKSPELEALVTRCWSTFPQDRPSTGAVVQDLTALHRTHLEARITPI